MARGSNPTFCKILFLTVACVATLASSSARAASPKQVDDSVDKAVAYLLSLQQADGSWDRGPRPPKPTGGIMIITPTGYAAYGGHTALATYALLAAGQDPKSPQMTKAITWLVNTELYGTYGVAFRTQVWNLLPERLRTKQILALRDRDRDFMLYSRIQKGSRAGFYGYTYGDDTMSTVPGVHNPLNPAGPPDIAWYDRSNSQYGVLGAWAVEQAGAEIPMSYWDEEDTAWKKAQSNDGGWNYNDIDPTKIQTTYSMTSAGLATLFITQDYMMRANPRLFETCKGGFSNPNIDRALAWMDKHIDQALGQLSGFYYYGVYGIERIGVASGRKYFGTVDWYRTGADSLLAKQAPDGSFNKTDYDTSFSILFLVRGRAPVMMNKLQYVNVKKAQVDPWNERPRDAANLAKWMGTHSIEGFLNWQIVNLDVSVDDLHDAPILYLTGSEPIDLSAEHLDKLRLFVEQGGMLLGNADCGKLPFATSFKKLGNKLFPKYEFRPLPKNHPIFSEQYIGSKWKTHMAVEGLSNGVRELMVLIPQADLGKSWQNDSIKIREEAFQLGGNIFLYSTGKENLQHKGETYVINATAGAAAREIKLARIMLGDNSDPEPGAYRRLGAYMHNDRLTDIKVTPVKLGDGSLAGNTVATLTGTTRIKLSDAQRTELKDFVEKGGTLIVDAAGGSAEFADSMEIELKQIFGDAGAKGLAAALPPTHALFTDVKWKIDAGIKYRTFAKSVLAGNQRDPRLRAITTADGRLGVFFSREDLTAGLVGQPVDGIVGYDPKTALPLMANLIQFAAAGGKVD